jgi:NADH-quinone oxidoreductase subunit K
MLHPITTTHYLVLSAALLGIGTLGVNAVNINLVAFSHHFNQVNGQIFAIFVITVAVAEAAVGLGILIALFRNKETVLADEINLLKW